MNKKIVSLVMVLGVFSLLGAGCVKEGTKQTTTTNTSMDTPVAAAISVSEQSLGSDNQVLIDSASIGDNGWVVIHLVTDGKPGPIIGHAALGKGTTSNIKVSIETKQLTQSLIAMLHFDRGEKGVFEFPGTDGPVIVDQKVVMKEFNLKNFAAININAGAQVKPVEVMVE